MKLPQKFIDKMEALLGEEYEDFIGSYDTNPYHGLRVNRLKLDVEEFKRISPFKLQSIPWTKDGFYYQPESDQAIAPGKHPYYHAGLYYIQEPSAMAPAAIIDAKPGEKILDLCAAPGGKSIQIAAGLNGRGILVANDINSNRVKALVKNIELYGVKNAVVTNETPQHLAEKFEGYFDKILVDAPCSGEGMMRKDENAAKSWEKFNIESCSTMQRDILKYVDRMLKPGGILCYSTCTFSPEENEGTMTWFLENNPYYEVIEIQKVGGMSSGNPQWIKGNNELTHSVRFWPHKIKGEGHYVALLRKKDGMNSHATKYINQPVEKQSETLWEEFETDNINETLKGTIQVYGHNLCLIPDELPDIKGLNVIRTGLQLGSIEKKRFKPSQALVMALPIHQFKDVLNLDIGAQEVIRYLKGETLMLSGEKGWRVVGVGGYPIGWGKQIDGILKNGYPKAWRKMK